MPDLLNYLNSLDVILGLSILFLFIIAIINAHSDSLKFIPVWSFPLLLTVTIFLQVYSVTNYLFLIIFFLIYLGFVWYHIEDVRRHFQGKEKEEYNYMMRLAYQLNPSQCTAADIDKILQLRKRHRGYLLVNILGMCAGGVKALFSDPSLYDALAHRELLNEFMWTPAPFLYQIIILMLCAAAVCVCAFLLIRDFASKEKIYPLNFFYIITICIIRFAFYYQFVILFAWNCVLDSGFDLILSTFFLLTTTVLPIAGIFSRKIPNVENAERELENQKERARQWQIEHDRYMSSDTDHGSGSGGGGSYGGSGGGSSRSRSYSGRQYRSYDNLSKRKSRERKGQNCEYVDYILRTCKLKNGKPCNHYWNDTCEYYKESTRDWD